MADCQHLISLFISHLFPILVSTIHFSSGVWPIPNGAVQNLSWTFWAFLLVLGLGGGAEGYGCGDGGSLRDMFKCLIFRFASVPLKEKNLVNGEDCQQQRVE